MNNMRAERHTGIHWGQKKRKKQRTLKVCSLAEDW